MTDAGRGEKYSDVNDAYQLISKLVLIKFEVMGKGSSCFTTIV